MNKSERKKLVLVGNVLVDPEILRKCLKKTCYFLNYDPEKELIDFWMNDGSGKETIFEIRNASLENAQKLAEGLGLESDGDGEDATMWSKFNPKAILHDDGSPEAEVLRVMLLEANFPFRTIDSKKLAVTFHPGIYEWPFEQLKKVVQEQIDNNKKDLEATP